MPLGFHICLRLANDAILAASPAHRRLLARVVLRQGRDASLLAFGQADNHLHLATACDRRLAGKCAHAVEVSARRKLALDASFTPAFVKPIDDARHLYSTFRYVLQQRAHHGLDVDPLREASNLPDLLGLRAIGAYTRANVRRLLPRVHRNELLEILGVSELTPGDGPLDQVVDATLAAAALPALAGLSLEVLAARCALVEVVGRQTTPAALARRIGVSRRTLFRLRARRGDGELVRSIRLQLGLLARLPAASAPPDAAFAE